MSTVKDCGTPPAITYGGISPYIVYNTTFNSNVTYRCDGIGYTMTGSPIVRCSEEGTWQRVPVCHSKYGWKHRLNSK